jgi:hypothetical protein
MGAPGEEEGASLTRDEAGAPIHPHPTCTSKNTHQSMKQYVSTGHLLTYCGRPCAKTGQDL